MLEYKLFSVNSTSRSHVREKKNKYSRRLNTKNYSFNYFFIAPTALFTAQQIHSDNNQTGTQ